MIKHTRNNKGAALMIAMLVLLFLCVLSSASFMRYAAEQGTSQREKALVQAFYSAEEGINYAYAELSQHNFDWNTHQWSKKTLEPNSSLTSNAGGSFNTDGSYYINDSKNPHYFKVITYPELDQTGLPNGVTIIHSQGWDHQDDIHTKGIATRTLELRVSKNSMFDYFYFYPGSRNFSGGTYDGAGYGKIHVNGRILFYSSPTTFTNLKELSTADTAHNGYFLINSSQYSAPRAYDGNPPDGITGLSQSGSPPYNYGVPGDLYYIWNKFSTSTPSVNGIRLPATLDKEYLWDKYSGDRAIDEKPVSWKIDNSVLAWLAYQKGKGGILNGKDYDIFIANPSAFNWEEWKSSPENAAKGFTAPRADTTGALAQQFWRTWLGNNPSNINQEWWTDLTYGNDRIEGDNIGINFFNTKEQADKWQEWLGSKEGKITQADTGKTEKQKLSEVIKDSSNGANYLTPIGLNNNGYKLKAQDGGICLMNDYTLKYQDWLNKIRNVTIPSTGEVVQFAFGNIVACPYFYKYCMTSVDYSLCNEFMSLYSAIYAANPPPPSKAWNNQELQDNGIVTFTQFFNPIRQPGSVDGNYAYSLQNAKPTKIMDIDVEKLNSYLKQTGKSFNGILYIESTDNIDTAYDFSVRMKNAGVLPENGLVVVTPHNIYAQGSFNLDKTRDGASEAFQTYVNKHGGIDSEYKWRPAALISSKRAIYTISEDFDTYIRSIGSLAEIAPYNYITLNGNYGSSALKNSEFLNLYVANQGLPGGTTLAAVDTFFANHPEITRPAQWTTENIKTIFDPSKYYDAGNAQQALLNAGESRYDLLTETKQPNRVSSDVIYNAAMVSPYDAQGYILERWIDSNGKTKKRQITGSFIQLQETERLSIPLSYAVYIYDENNKYVTSYREVSPGYIIRTCSKDGNCTNSGSYYRGYHAYGYGPYYSGWYNPSSTYAYEVNFAKIEAGESLALLSASAIDSWLEVPNEDFCPKCQ